MGQMVIRNIPDDVMRRFKLAAKKAGKSAEQLAREALAEKADNEREELMLHMDKLRAMTTANPEIDIVAEIRKDRDRNHPWDEQIDDSN